MMENALSRLRQDVFRGLSVGACVLYLLIYVSYNIDLATLAPDLGLSIDYNELQSTGSAKPQS